MMTDVSSKGIRRAGVPTLIVGMIFALSGTAAAESKKVEAEAHYDQGKAYYRTGAYDLAIQEFLEGYRIDPRGGVLFNIARGYEELKDRGKAIEFYKKYLDQGAQATAATEARARMVALERAIKEEDDRRKADAAEREHRKNQPQPLAGVAPPPGMATPVAAVPVAPVPNAPAPGATPVPATVTSPAADTAIIATASPPESSARAGQLKLAGLVTGGAGVLCAGVGAFFMWRGSSIKTDINNEIATTGTWTPALSSRDSDMHTANALAVISFAVGGAAVAGGAVLYALGWSKTPHDGAPSAFLSPVVGPNGATGLLLRGRF